VLKGNGSVPVNSGKGKIDVLLTGGESIEASDCRNEKEGRKEGEERGSMKPFWGKEANGEKGSLIQSCQVKR